MRVAVIAPIVLAIACGSSSQAKSTPPHTLAPAWDSPVPKAIRPQHFGHNAVWSRGGLGIWDEAARAPSSEMLALLHDLHPGALRFPGGTRAMRYHFDGAIGAYDARTPQCDVFTGATDATTYGLREFLSLAEDLHADVTLVAPWADGSPQRTAAMVAYASAAAATNAKLGIDADGKDWGTATDWTYRRFMDGRAQPWNVSMIEIGNEPYLDLAVGPSSSCGRPSQFRQDERWEQGVAIPTTARDYALQLNATASLVRAVNPSIKIGAAAYSSYDGTSDAAKEVGDVDRMQFGDAWNARLVSDASDAFDVFVLHPYDLTFTDARVQLGARLEKTIRDLSALAPSKGIAITEFGFLGGGDTMMNVVASADIVRVGIEAGALMVLRHVLVEDNPDEPFANSAAILGPSHTRQPSYWLMQLLATKLAGLVVPTNEVAPDIEALATTTLSSGGVAVLLVDRRVDAAGPTDIALALPAGAMRGTLHILHADALSSNAVVIDEKEISTNGSLSLTLPPNGVAVVALER
jgi:hypothetical protein